MGFVTCLRVFKIKSEYLASDLESTENFKLEANIWHIHKLGTNMYFWFVQQLKGRFKQRGSDLLAWTKSNKDGDTVVE